VPIKFYAVWGVAWIKWQKASYCSALFSKVMNFWVLKDIEFLDSFSAHHILKRNSAEKN